MFFDLLMLLLGVVLTMGTFIFVFIEFSLVVLNQVIVRERAAQGDPRAKAVFTTMRTSPTQLSGAQIGITLTTTFLGYTTRSTLMGLLLKGFVSTGLAYALASGATTIIAVIVISAFSMLFDKLIPKDLALTHPLKTVRFVTALQILFTSVVEPLVLVLNETANGVLRLTGIKPREEISPVRSVSELEAMLRCSVQKGTIDASTTSLFMNAIHISDLTTIGVTTDRGRMRILGLTTTAANVMVLSHKSGHSRFPVIGSGLGDVIGLASLRRAIAVPFEHRAGVPVTSSSLLAGAPFVPETVPIGPLVVQLRDEGLQTTVAADEHGGVPRAVTLEDVIEGIIDEVSDERDRRRKGTRTRSNR